MKTTRNAAQLGKMLDLCEDLQRIRTRIADPLTGRDERTRLRQQTQRRVDRLARELASFRGRGPLARLLRTHRVGAQEFEVLSVLLQRAVRAEAPEMEGRLILGSIFDTSYGVLSGLHLLHEDARLRTSGLVRVADDQAPGTDVLEMRFRLSEEALAALREEVAGRQKPRRRVPTPLGYRSQRELLLDLRLLVNHYLRRSELVFEPSRWESLAHRGENATTVSRRIEALWAEIRTKLLRSPEAGTFPLVRLIREQRLGDAETVIVVHLLFRELYSGEALVEVAELLRLVSANESELLRARRLVVKDAPLLRRQILAIEPFVENRELTGEARLNDWVVNDLLDSAEAQTIRPDERLRFHQYLDDLSDSSRFYRDLDA